MEHMMPSIHKAKEMLGHGEVRGKALSKKQKGLFGLIAGGKKPSKMKKMAKKMREHLS